MLDLSVGVLDGEGDTGGKATVALDFVLFTSDRMVSMTAGIGAGLMTDEEFGNTDFGGPLYFVFQAGASYWLNPSFSIGYRYHHESNASIYDTNPSLNLHQLELRLLF
jgi:hypothetical protein